MTRTPRPAETLAQADYAAVEELRLIDGDHGGIGLDAGFDVGGGRDRDRTMENAVVGGYLAAE